VVFASKFKSLSSASLTLSSLISDSNLAQAFCSVSTQNKQAEDSQSAAAAEASDSTAIKISAIMSSDDNEENAPSTEWLSEQINMVSLQRFNLELINATLSAESFIETNKILESTHRDKEKDTTADTNLLNITISLLIC